MESKYSNEEEWKLYCISKKQEVEKLYTIRMMQDFHVNETINLDNPLTINEKLNWLKVYDSDYLKAKCSDKILVREYCKEKIGKDLFIPIIKVYNNFDEINFDELPNNYVLKTNHGSHTNIIVKNKNINIITAKRNFNEWLSKDWTFWGLEMPYELIDRKIFAEEYKENINTSNNVLTDYKFLCFNGQPIYCLVISNRNSYRQHLNYYDMEFNFVNISRIGFKNDPNNLDIKPKSFELMKKYALTLSNDFKFVRVDFYEIDNLPYLSELTFFPAAGYIKYENSEDQKRIGDLLKL